MRKRIYEIIGEVTDESDDRLSHYYDMGMIVVIVASLIPLMFKRSTPAFSAVNYITTAIFIVDYGLRLLIALVMFNVEPETFDSFFEAIYWAPVSLTTMGYGDIYPTSVFGRIVTMVSSFIGIAVVALPAGIITAGYTHEIQRQYEVDENNESEEEEK